VAFAKQACILTASTVLATLPETDFVPLRTLCAKSRAGTVQKRRDVHAILTSEVRDPRGKMSASGWLCIICMMLATFPTIHVISCSSPVHARIVSSPRLAFDRMDPGSMPVLGSHFALEGITHPLRLRGGVQGWVDTTQEKKVWANKRHAVSRLSP
jgi:hypothetical protein